MHDKKRRDKEHARKPGDTEKRQIEHQRTQTGEQKSWAERRTEELHKQWATLEQMTNDTEISGQEPSGQIKTGQNKSSSGRRIAGTGETPDVAISVQPQREKYEHLVALRTEKTRRNQYLELRAARQGITTDPSVLMEIEDLRDELALLDGQIALLPDKQYILTFEQQQAVLVALAAAGCEFIDRIRLIDIVIGSVIVLMEMPLAGAARLMAMYLVRHPQLARQGITRVEFATQPDNFSRESREHLQKAVRFERKDLEENQASAASPFANSPEVVQLRVTVEPDKLKVA